MARVLRFTRAVRTVRSAPGAIDWLDVAGECGYFDQAHLIREFREFAGMTPAEFAARQLPFGGVDGTPV
jgi:AraC-like DNA-binding protein